MKYISKAKVIVFAAVGFVLLTYNNCSEVGFSPTSSESGGLSNSLDNGQNQTETGADQSSSNTSASSVADSDPSTSEYVIDSNTEVSLLNDIPEADLNEPKNVYELEQDPELYNVYKCPDSDGVIICHFPENVEAAGTLCVGRNAVSKHYSHVRQYELGSGPKTIADYLGPCRVSL